MKETIQHLLCGVLLNSLIAKTIDIIGNNFYGMRKQASALQNCALCQFPIMSNSFVGAGFIILIY